MLPSWDEQSYYAEEDYYSTRPKGTKAVFHEQHQQEQKRQGAIRQRQPHAQQRMEDPHIDVQRMEAQRMEVQRMEAQQTEAQRMEAQRMEVQRMEASGWKCRGWRPSGWKCRGWRPADGSAEDGGQADGGPGMEAQQTEAQRMEAQRMETQRKQEWERQHQVHRTEAQLQAVQEQERLRELRQRDLDFLASIEGRPSASLLGQRLGPLVRPPVNGENFRGDSTSSFADHHHQQQQQQHCLPQHLPPRHSIASGCLSSADEAFLAELEGGGGSTSSYSGMPDARFPPGAFATNGEPPVNSAVGQHFHAPSLDGRRALSGASYHGGSSDTYQPAHYQHSSQRPPHAYVSSSAPYPEPQWHPTVPSPGVISPADAAFLAKLEGGTYGQRGPPGRIHGHASMRGGELNNSAMPAHDRGGGSGPVKMVRGIPRGGVNGCPEEGVNGNWRCMSCFNINFGHRHTCNRCKEPR